jgi:hypothetical protein
MLFYLQQLTRLCIWSAVADVYDPDAGSFAFWKRCVAKGRAQVRALKHMISSHVHSARIQNYECMLFDIVNDNGGVEPASGPSRPPHSVTYMLLDSIDK